MENDVQTSDRANSDVAELTSTAIATAEKQLAASIETFRFLVDLTVKAWTFLIAADGLILGYGFLSRASGPIFCSALITAVAAVVPAMMYRSLIPLAYSAYVAEKSLTPNSWGIVEIFGRTMFSGLLCALEAIRVAPTTEQPVMLRNLSKKRPWSVGLRIGIVVSAVFLTQMLIGVYFAANGAPLFATVTAEISSVLPTTPTAGPTSTATATPTPISTPTP